MLESDLKQQHRANKVRTSELDRRQQLFESKEAAVVISNMRKESKLRKAKAAQEQELNQQRQDFEERKAAQLAALENRERLLNARENALIAREEKHRKRRISTPERIHQEDAPPRGVPATKPSSAVIKPMSNDHTTQASAPSRASTSYTKVMDLIVKNCHSKELRNNVVKESESYLATPRKVRSAEELRKKVAKHQIPKEKGTSGAKLNKDILSPLEDSDIVVLKPTNHQVAAKPKRGLNRQANKAFNFEIVPNEEKVNVRATTALAGEADAPKVAVGIAPAPAKRYGLRSAALKK